MTEFKSKYQSRPKVLKSRGANSNILYLSATVPASIQRQKIWAEAMASLNRPLSTSDGPVTTLCTVVIKQERHKMSNRTSQNLNSQ